MKSDCHSTRRSAVGAAALAAGLLVGAMASAALPIDKLQLPAGFRVEVLSDAVPNARQMALGRNADGKGVVYVGSAQAGKTAGRDRSQSPSAFQYAGVRWRSSCAEARAASVDRITQAHSTGA
jgi:hypothetical protein